LVRFEVDAGAAAQPFRQVVDGGVGERATVWAALEVDEHVVRVEGAVLAFEIVGIQRHQFRAGWQGRFVSGLPSLVLGWRSGEG
jgi:hypothetical protein